MNDPVLSIVVIGRNEGHRLARCLESVAALRGLSGQKQIIYVDSASTDDKTSRPPSHRRQNWLAMAPSLSIRERALRRNIGNGLNVEPIDLYRDGLRNRRYQDHQAKLITNSHNLTFDPR